MPQPTSYTPTTDFSADEAANTGGRSTVRTAQLDAEFTGIQATLAGVLANLALNQRDDGEVRDERVKLPALSSDVKALLAVGQGLPRGLWLTGTVYALRDVVLQGANTYICSTAHTAGTFATDLAAVRWLLLALGVSTAASSVPFTPTAALTSTNVQAAIDEADTEGRALSAASLAASAALALDLANTADAAKGAALVGYSPALAYAAGTTGGKLNEALSSAGFASLQAALTAAAGKSLRVVGSYTITAAVTVPANTYVFSQGGEGTVTQTTAGQNALTLSGDGITIDGLRIVGPNSGAGSAIRGDSLTAPTVRNCVIQSWLYGVQLRGCKNPRVADNRMYGGTYDSSSSADIFIYGSSGTPSNRVIVTGNFCLSNNDNGISIDTNSGDREVVITGNVVFPLQSDGATPLSDANNRRRYGIIAGYNGTTATRAVISGNVVKDIPHSGIYIQAATLPAGDVAITGNLVSRCGFGTIYPADASLRAGIFFAGSGADSVTGNVVVDCTTAGIKIAPDFAYSSANQPRSVVSGNTVARTIGIGIYMTNRPHGYLISTNRVVNSTSYNIYYETTSADGGNCTFSGNHIDSNSTNFGGMTIANALGGYPCYVHGNTISGADNTTNDQFNSGVWFTGLVHVASNAINKFHRGVNCADTISTRNITTKCANNVFKNCATGVSAAGNGPWLVEANTFDTVTAPLNGAPYQGVLLQSGVLPGTIQTLGNAAPTTGTWANGDHVARQTQAVAAAKGWYCTVAGTPGTWVSEGNL